MNANSTVESAVNLVQQQLQLFASELTDLATFAIAFGENVDAEALTISVEQWAAGNFADLPNIDLLPADDMGGGVEVAFSPEQNTVYLSESFVTAYANDQQAIANVVLRGIGYAVDAVVNPQDSPGDEGSLFSLLVRGVALDPLTLNTLKSDPPPPELAIPQPEDGNVLQLQIGSHSGDWVTFRPDLGPLTTRNEQIEVASLSNGIQASGYGVTQVDLGSFSELFANAGGGNDVIDLTDVIIPGNLLGGTGNDSLIGGADSDTLNGGLGNDQLAGGLHDDVMIGGGGQDIFIFREGDGVDTIKDFGGLGRDTQPRIEVEAEVDVLKFEGAGFTAESILLTQAGDNLEITFENVADTKVILENFALENFDNYSNHPIIGNILFDGQTEIEDSIDVFDAISKVSQIWNPNQVTFLNDLANDIRGFDESDDVIHGLGGNDIIQSLGGNDLLRGGTGDDVLTAGSGDDRLVGGLGGDVLDGGVGNDTISYGLSLIGVIASLTTGTGVLGEATNDRYFSIENIEGSNNRDRLFGDQHDNQLWGRGSDDRLDGRGGNDRALGGDGSDRLFGGDGNDWLEGNDDDDELQGNEGKDSLYGGSGNDTLNGNDGDDSLWGDDGDDVMSGGGDNDELQGGQGNDTIVGNDGDDMISGGADNDTLSGGHGSDSLYGNAGDDRLQGNAGNDDLFGGEGDDSLLSGGDGNDQIIGGAGDDGLKGDDGQDHLEGNDGDDILEGGDGDDQLYGGDNNDVLFGGRAQDRLFGEMGNDQLFGEMGNDQLNGNAGQDTLEGGTGDDHLYGGVGNDELSGGDSNDILFGNADKDLLEGDHGDDYLIGGEGNDHLHGGIGFDGASYETSPDRAVVNLDNTRSYNAIARPFDLLYTFDIGVARAKDGFDTLDTFEIDPATDLVTVEKIIGSNFDDVLIGDRQDNEIQGIAGNDLIIGNAGDDRLDGGLGNDTISYHEENNAVTVDLALEIAIDGNSDTDTLIDFENIVGSAFADSLNGSNVSNIILANLGNDSLIGGGDRDTFIFREGDGIDTIKDFGGVGLNAQPRNEVEAEVDVLKFEGAGFTAESMILTQVGDNLEITFESVANTKVILENVALETLDNYSYPPIIGNFIFDGQTEIEDSIDVFDADSDASQIWNPNKVTFLNDLDNEISGFNQSNDVINAQGGDDTIDGLSGDDVLRGGDGDDTLIGGLGNDTLVGGAGADSFQFTELEAGVNTIRDFSRAEGDRLLISQSGFGGDLSLGLLSEEQFTLGSAASRESDRLIYNSSTGGLFYDADGTGATGQQKIAQLSGSPNLSASDILVVV